MWAVSVTAPALPSVARRSPVRGLLEPGAHGRVADGGGPGPCLAARIRWSAAFDSGRRKAVCKTVGSAYVGSNPTPATTCENGPLAVNSRLSGPFPSCHPCIMMCHRESMCRGVHGRIADGFRVPGRSVHTVGDSTDGHGRAVPGGTFRAGRPPLSRACVPPDRPAAPVSGRNPGRRMAGAVMAVVVRERVTAAGPAERVWVTRPGCRGAAVSGRPGRSMQYSRSVDPVSRSRSLSGPGTGWVRAGVAGSRGPGVTGAVPGRP